MLATTIFSAFLIAVSQSGPSQIIHSFASRRNATGIQSDQNMEGIAHQTIVELSSKSVNDMDHDNIPSVHSKSVHFVDLISRLENYAVSLSHTKFTRQMVGDIKQIYQTLKTDKLYSLSLPNLIQLSHQNIVNKLGTKNFIIFMKLLHIQPLSMNDLDSPKYDTLDIVSKLLIISSRAIIHNFAMTNLFDYKSPHFDATSQQIDYANYPWLQPVDGDYDRLCMLDNMKRVYEHSFDYLSHKTQSKLAPLDSIYAMNDNDNQYLLHLMDDFGFIPWNRATVRNNTQIREFGEYAQCYSIGTNVIFSEIAGDDDLPYDFMSHFDMSADYKRTVCHDQCQ